MSRKFMVPIVLPANPVQPMEAATKQYVDALSGNEVWIDPNQPTDPVVELWVDTDDIANPGDEVFVGPDDPISQAPNIELWYDTDDPTGNAGSIPAGGSAGQVLTKVSNTDYDDAWMDNASVPPGGLAGQVLAKKTATNYDDEWVTPVQLVKNTYTPTLTGMVLGVGGTNQGDYLYIGGPNVGDWGEMTVQGRIVFGTSGQTYPTSNLARIALPTGFDMALTYTTWELGQIRYNMGGIGYTGALGQVPAEPHAMQLFIATQVGAAAGQPIAETPPTASIPPWVASAEIRWKATLQVVRV